MEHFEGTFRGVGDVELYYQGWQPEDTPKATLAILPGFGEHGGRYGNVVNWFVPRGYAALALDVRGNGRSGGPRGYINSFEEIRSDVRAFLDLVRSREPGSPLFLLGHSQGGLAAADYVLHEPSGLDGMIASSPLLCPLPIAAHLVFLSRVLSKVWPRLTLNSGLDVTALSRDKAVVQAYVADPLVKNVGTPRLATELEAAVAWTQAHACDLVLPILIVHGSADRLSACGGSQTFFDACSSIDKERIVYEGGYHELFNDLDKEKVLADVEAWLERHLQAGSGRAG
jgi:alpha-beta hydrolase superfamily lysophospholipase